MKQCSRCKIVKDENEFPVYTRIYNYNGRVVGKRLRARCRECTNFVSSEWVRIFKEKNPELAKERGYASNRRIGNRFSYSKADAKRRDVPFDITLGQFRVIVSNPCYYCNGVLIGAGSGLDRVDSSKGYLLENVVPCCKRCNVAKSNLSVGDFRKAVTKVYEHWASK